MPKIGELRYADSLQQKPFPPTEYLLHCLQNYVCLVIWTIFLMRQNIFLPTKHLQKKYTCFPHKPMNCFGFKTFIYLMYILSKYRS